MAYTPPEGSLTFDFTEEGYTPAENPLDFDFSPPGANFTPWQAPRSMAEWFDDETQQWYSTETDQWEPIEGEFEDPPAEPRRDYEAPTWKDINFRFTTGGYTAPDFSAISFQWFSQFSAVMNLGATITASHYRDTTYSEVVRRNIYALGYGNPGWQILKGKTEYTGIRDLGAHLYGFKQYADLFAYILGKSPYDIVDLGAIIDVFLGVEVPIDLGAFLGPIPPQELPAYIKSTTQAFVDLGGYLRAWHIKDLGAWLGSVHETDLLADIFGIGPVDLPAYLKVWEQRDLLARLVGWAEKDLGATILGLVYTDLPGFVKVIAHGFKDLGAHIRNWQREVPADLGALIDSLSFTDIGGTIFGREFGELWAYINAVAPKDLPAFLHGWQEFDLIGIISGLTDKQFDLAAFLNVSPWVDLPAYMRPMYPFDLGAIISSWYESDIGATINPIEWAQLWGIINATGQAEDLGAILIPRLVKLTTLLTVHTMEHIDLGAVMNLAPCYYHEIADLPAYLYTIYKADLIGTVYGLGLFGANIRDLKATIGITESVFDLSAADTLAITFSAPSNTYALDDLYVNFFNMALTVDEMVVGFMPGGGRHISANLLASLVGHFTNLDLAASINGVTQAPFTFRNLFGEMLSSTPLFTAPYIYKNIKEWERIVQITFFSAVYDYFYQSATETLWREDNDAKWVLDVESWVAEDELFQDKKDVRSKYVFDLTQFESVDEAVRYAIDWVLAFKQKDLTAQITGRPWGTTDLSAYIITPDTPLYTSFQNLTAYVRPWHPENLIAQITSIDEWLDLAADITGSP